MTTTTSSADNGGGGSATAVSSPSPPNLLPNAAGQQRICGGQSPVSPATGTQIQLARPTLLMDVAIRCTAVSCSCDCFSPCKAQIRICDGCGHGWVSHALDKLGFRHLFNCHQVEVVQPSIAFDVASLMLYGTQAIPVRLKILLDRLFSVLQHDEVLQVLHGFGWTHEDYARGYIVQDPSGAVLDRWLLASREEEPLILQQFLRFGETKTIAQQLLLQESSERSDFVIQPPRTESDIKKFIERTNRSVGSSLFKQHSSHIYSHMGSSAQSMTMLGNKPSFRHLSSNVNSTQSASPTITSPINSTSPIALSPLNKLQNMQPYDFRQDKSSPDLPKSENVERQASVTASLYGINSVTSPTTSVPHISFSTSSLTNVSSTNNSSTYTTASSERSGNDDGVYCSEGDDEDASNTAINLTRSSLTTSYMDSVYAAKKVRHLRKSANPMKRRWNPTVLATLSTNPATGKKRVQCHVCLKTFCDKGALKIHFSAVHLREMHKCTVEGCNMMFSSRRSRNRHSANPNPKLHTPNYRRKINPHDGRAANPYPMVPPSGILDFTNGMITSYSSGAHDGESSSESEMDGRSASPRKNSISEMRSDGSSAEKRNPLSNIDDDVPLPLTKKFRMEENIMNNCGDEGIDLSMKEERKKHENDGDVKENCRDPERDTNNKDSHSNHLNDIKDLSITGSKSSPVPFQPHRIKEDKEKHETEDGKKVSSESSKQNTNNSNHTEIKIQIEEKDRIMSTEKSVRKRKSLNPTKCPTTSDDDLQFASSDDSSSDTYIDQDNDDNGLLDSKSDYLTSDGSDSINELDDIDDNSDNEKEKKLAIKTSSKSETPPASSVVVSTAKTSTPKNSIEKNYHGHERYNGFSMSDLDKFRDEITMSQLKENDDINENPLRHLESLSLGAFTNMMNVNREMNNRANFNQRGTSISSGVSYHAPGLGLGSVTTTTAPNRVESPGMEMMPSLVSSSHPPPLTSNCHLNNSDTENSMSDQQMGMVPVFRDASMVGSVEIPVDKENPRRCTACGKIFQNHFGVKTHYQNVHLKLMHKCTVEGCNASFPSKRSRDRHSANLNLHRKLLSTTSERGSGSYFDKGGTMYPFHPDAYRGDIFSRLYDHNSLPLSFADIYHNRLSTEGAGSPFLGTSPFSHLPGAIPGFHPAFLPPATSVANYKNENNSRYHHEQNSGRNSSISSISNPSSPGPSLRGSPRDGSGHLPAVKLEEDLHPDSDGRFVCTICEKRFHEAVVLREHYEKSHTQGLLHCSMNGCNKVFLSRQSRNIHSDNIHKEKNVDAT